MEEINGGRVGEAEEARVSMVEEFLLDLFLAQHWPDRIEDWSIVHFMCPQPFYTLQHISSTFQGITHSLTKLVPEHS